MAENCPDCSDLSQKSDICFSNDKIFESIQSMGQNKPEKTSYKMAALLATENPIADNDKGKETIKKLRELAKDTSQLELKTQRAVRTVQSYGENCKEAAEDFLEDGNVSDLLEELKDVGETNQTLQDALNNHNIIK
jgi:hypothetical protein